MLDALFALLIAALALRGWRRGLVREALDLAALVAGVVLAWRFSDAIGAAVHGITGISPGLSRFLGGFAAFLLVSVGAGFAAAVIHRSMRALPALTTLNRVSGASLGVAFGVVLVGFAVAISSLAPMPTALSEQLDGSAIATAVEDLLASGRVPQL